MSDGRQRLKPNQSLGRILPLPSAPAMATRRSQLSSGGEDSNKAGSDEGFRAADRLRPGSESATAAAVKTTTSKSSDPATSAGGEAPIAPIPVLTGSGRVAASSSASSGNTRPVSLVSGSATYPESLWQEALESLPVEDRPPSVQESYGIINGVLEKTKVEICKRQTGKFTLGVKQYDSREVANKVIGWIQKFKEVGDIVVQYDPVHLALPWAVFRFILQVSSAKYTICQNMI